MPKTCSFHTHRRRRESRVSARRTAVNLSIVRVKKGLSGQQFVIFATT